ncbi:hypothetical protein CL633_01495 [bacterium]|nr:hypothetical protein [bacterium]|tara:strand:+ start:1154 stop:1504 length:351 start_codon:yes stop_codon:yes gene_type:complete
MEKTMLTIQNNEVKNVKLEDIFLESGTSLQGEIKITYQKLVEIFGKPNSMGDEYKIDAEWVIWTNSGCATIYNWKDGKNYNGQDGQEVKNITTWHIGGHSERVVNEIKRVLNLPLE